MYNKIRINGNFASVDWNLGHLLIVCNLKPHILSQVFTETLDKQQLFKKSHDFNQ